MTVCSIIANRFKTEANPNYKQGIRDLIGSFSTAYDRRQAT